MTEKTIMISGIPVKLKSSAAVPRRYRLRFGRDIFKDLLVLQKDFEKNQGSDISEMELKSLEIFENIAYIMAWHADPDIPDTIDEWLEQFEIFSIYEILPEILELWGQNTKTDVVPKKK